MTDDPITEKRLELTTMTKKLLELDSISSLSMLSRFLTGLKGSKTSILG